MYIYTVLGMYMKYKVFRSYICIINMPLYVLKFKILIFKNKGNFCILHFLAFASLCTILNGTEV